MIDAGSLQVIGLHRAGSRAAAVNFAVPMAEILAQSKVLTASAGGGGGDATERAEAETKRKRLAAEAERLAREKVGEERPHSAPGGGTPVEAHPGPDLHAAA